MKYDVRIGIEITLHVGCSVNCSYCPQSVFLKNYKDKCDWSIREFTLDSFKEMDEKGEIPVDKNYTFMGYAEPFQCRDAAKIMKWALRERGHMGSVSTTLHGITKEDIDVVASLKDRMTDIVLHAPASDGRMPGLKVDSNYVELFKYAIDRWRDHSDFVIQVYDTTPHEAIHGIWAASGVHIPRYGLHDRAGLLPDLQGPYVKHGKHSGPLPICGKQLNGHIMPDFSMSRCCNDWSLICLWGNLRKQTYHEIMHSQKFRDYIKSLQDPNSDVPCRKCWDGYKQCNVEDRNKGYDLIGH
jgi:hypothetical protein